MHIRHYVFTVIISIGVMSIAASECRRAQALLRQGKSMTEGASATVIVCAATHQQLLTIMVGLLVFFGWQFGGLS